MVLVVHPLLVNGRWCVIGFDLFAFDAFVVSTFALHHAFLDRHIKPAALHQAILVESGPETRLFEDL